MERSYTVEQLEKTVPLEEILRDCVDVPYFLGLCRACPNYGNRWSCPPYSMEPLSVWLEYDALHLIIRVLRPEAGMDQEAAIAMVERERRRFSDDLLELEKGRPAVRALAAGPCMRCGAVCARREGKLCRMPDKVRFSIESLGGNVSALTERYFGKSLLWMKDGVVPAYFVLAGGLFIKHTGVS